jgi:hypothetical protein
VECAICDFDWDNGQLDEVIILDDLGYF